MEFTQDILEYYDELFPVSSSQKEFFLSLIDELKLPPRLLSIGCGVGSFEHVLSREGYDVTGIDGNQLLLESATRRRRPPGVSIRFFNMSILEMARFLGANFYSVISCLNNRIAGIHDIILMRKFFYDCRSLLAKNGRLVLQLPNYMLFRDEPVCNLPVTQSIRAKLRTKVFTSPEGDKTLLQQVETSSGRLVTVIDREALVLVTAPDIQSLAKEAGFKKVEFFSDFNKSDFDPENSQNLVCLLG